MNRLMEQKWSWIEGSHGMRTGLLDALTDADLKFSPGGQAMTLGKLCREMGEIQYSYLQSLKTLKQDFEYRNTTPGMDTSVSQLKAWFQQMDEDMKATLEAMSEADVNKSVARAGGFDAPLEMQLDIYIQALLIFFGKASIYLRVMNKPLPQSIQDWIG